MQYIKSQIDNTIKYTTFKNNIPIHFSYINKNDGKDIICTPSQSSCKLGCAFCHLTGKTDLVINLTSDEIINPLHEIIDKHKANNTLLISYMGSGEPLLNIDNVLLASECIKQRYQVLYQHVRFAISTIIPNEKLFRILIKNINNIPMKLHWSLHATTDKIRQQLMPSTISINESLFLLDEYLKTNNDVEIHYTLMNNVNDTNSDLENLIKFFMNKNINVKFIAYNKKDNNTIPSLRVNEFINTLTKCNIKTEYYIPPGRDIGSSCGQF